MHQSPAASFARVVASLGALVLLGLVSQSLSGCPGPAGTPDAGTSVGSDGGQDGGAGSDGGGVADGGPDAGLDGGGPSDGGALPPADRVRYGVVSHPRDAQGAESSLYEVFQVDLDGQVTSTGETFTMGRATEGEIVFTPDGHIGLVAQQDGSVGVFSLDAAGHPTVLDAGLTGLYAVQVVMAPDGRHAYAVDFNWEQNGGGIYALAISDAGVTLEGRVLEGRSLGRMVLLDGGRLAAVAGRGVGGVLDASDLFLLDLTVSPPVQVAAVDLFGDDDAIVSALAADLEGRFLLVGDNNDFSGTGHRIGVAERSAGGLSARAVLPRPGNLLGLSRLEDPTAIFVSPFGGRALVFSGTGSAAYMLSFDPSAPGGGFALEARVSGPDPGPALPLGATWIRRGHLEGLVLVAELQHVRRYRFERDGTVTDLGRTELNPGGYQLPLGAIGVQP